MGQTTLQQLRTMEDSLVVLADSFYNPNILPDERPFTNERFIKHLIRALKVADSYNYPFDSLATRINILSSPDNTFRMFNWSVSSEEMNMRYYCAIQLKDEQLKLYGLVDISGDIAKTSEDTVLSNGKWYGALYYKIIPHDVDGKTYYTLIGKNSAGVLTNRKVLDPMYFADNGPVFGAPIFNIRSQARPTERINRYVIEYKKQSQASMNWDPELNVICFDRLVSETNDPARKYTYVPSGQYDGFRWIDGYWTLIQDLIPVDVLGDGKAPVPQPNGGRIQQK
ncbi:MAG: hypothetical protein JST82_04160 [Bacteroidetes bacterium]|nr:hypothetical protein [Bacteroidota bacterium]